MNNPCGDGMLAMTDVTKLKSLYLYSSSLYIFICWRPSVWLCFLFLSQRDSWKPNFHVLAMCVCVGGRVRGCADVEISNVSSGLETGRSKLGFGVHTHLLSHTHKHTHRTAALSRAEIKDNRKSSNRKSSKMN